MAAPGMASYLDRLQSRLAEIGATCPVSLIHFGDGQISAETAVQSPVRPIESGPIGGAVVKAADAQPTLR